MPDIQPQKIGLKFKPLSLMVLYELVTDVKTTRCRKIPLQARGKSALQVMEELLARPSHITLLSAIPKKKLLSVINRIPNIQKSECPALFDDEIKENEQSEPAAEPLARALVRAPSRASQQVMEALLNSDTDDDDSNKTGKSASDKENTAEQKEATKTDEEKSAKESSPEPSYTDPSESISENISEKEDSSFSLKNDSESKDPFSEKADESDDDIFNTLKSIDASGKKKNSNIPIFSDVDSDSESDATDSDDSFMRNLNQAKAHQENRSSTPSNVSEVNSILNEEKNLNILSDNELENVKKTMDVNFHKNQLTKDDADFKYDTREVFNPTVPSGWDSDDSF
ncbi:Oidioi.mRNA.OKI2018_I69.XSR.g15089.t1.cds [Oikopleura dioica]|uniref:Centrosomal protein of 19 kDa n=1 Tax=Oikopleura dioica TaxID=34765 RepID=A0ABN7SGX5_OIKDI|nr:Oidioi.mRNA.OKI2018_I69.XSR.g15089.t1.cds [Oikopleura dioica]